MAIERLEVRFSPSNPGEQAIITALESQSEYGAKGRFLKARLIRGYVRMMREMESIKSESDPLAALDRVAESMDAGTYYALRALLYPINTEPVSSGSALSAPEVSVAPAGPVVEPVAVATANNAPDEPLEVSVAAPAAVVVPDPVEADPVPSTTIECEQAVEAPVMRAEVLPASAAPAEAPSAIVADPMPADVDPVQDDVVPAAPTEAVAVEDAPVAPAPAVNWSRFAGIAGTRG